MTQNSTLQNGELQTINAKYVVIGTDEIKAWTDGEPFVIALNTEEDFERNGLEYKNYKNMALGETKDSCSIYEGILVIRVK